MTTRHPTHLVVDGSNIATEGRSTPSLEQLDEAVRAILEEFPHDRLTVVVDATFGHRIAESERPAYEEAILAGEIVAPPAGAVGRGDAFILQVADKADATVFSNDSFQEFHGEHEWLFDEGRLIGGKPVPGVGWVFVNRVPVRGPLSRRAVRESRRGKSTKARSTRSATTEPARRSRTAAEGKLTPVSPPPPPPAKRRAAEPAKAAAEEGPAVEPAAGRPRPPIDGSEALNEPAVFLAFITEHSIGSVVEATVDHFSSHGAYVIAHGARCYLPTKTMGDPPPNRARDVIDRGDRVRVEVQSLDAERRGINVRFVELLESYALAERPPSGLDEGVPAPVPTEEEPIPALEPRSESDVATKRTAGKRSAVKKAPSGRPAKEAAVRKAPIKKAAAEATPSPRAAKATARKAPVKKATTKRGAAIEAPEVPAEAAEAAQAATQGTPTKRTAKKTAAKKATTKKAAAKKATTKKAAAKKATASKAPTKRAAKATGEGPAPTARTSKKAAAAAKKATTKKATKRAPAKKAPAKKAASSRTRRNAG